ncbi:hypothetical protein OAK06_04525 [Gammaproteobacteria bacterium]|nr:hypothetical protein [Gammaproteobacteria bacterium]
MKTFISFLLISAPLSLFSKEIFFECDIDNPQEYGSYANIAYDSESNTASIESDYWITVTPAKGIIYKVLDILKTSDELIMQINSGTNNKTNSKFRINRNSLKLSGTRNGVCKIIKKDLAF